MTETFTSIAGRRLVGPVRRSECGAWYAAPGLGALRIPETALVARGAAERLTAVVRAQRELRLPGMLSIAELIEESGVPWLLLTEPPLPVVTDLLSAPVSGVDAGSAATLLNESAQTLLALHAAGMAHGRFGPDAIVVAADGTARLAEAGIVTALRGEPSDRRADARGWAALVRRLSAAWVPVGSPGADLLSRCATAAEAEGLDAGRRLLVRGKTALPDGFLDRHGLRAAASAAVSHLGVATISPEVPAADRVATATVRDERRAEPVPAVERTRVHSAHLDRSDHLDHSDHPDVDTRPGGDVPPDGDAAEIREEVLLRFGPGVCAAAETPAVAVWRAGRAQRPRRRRLTGGLVTVAFATAVAIILWWLLGDRGPGLEVRTVSVRTPPGVQSCDVTVNVTGVITTNGGAGQISYRWRRSDGNDSGIFQVTADRGQRTVQVPLRWTVQGTGSFHAVATLQILSPRQTESIGAFDYACQ